VSEGIVAKTTRTDGQVTIRPYRLNDVDDLYAAVRESIPELNPWMPFFHPDYSREESRAWIELQQVKWADGVDYAFCIRDADSDAYLGGVGLNQLNAMHRFANLGYWVRTSRTGQGVARRAALLMAAFGFEVLALMRLEIVVDVTNPASVKVAEAIGARREGVLRNRLYAHDASHDAAMYSLIPPR